VIDVLPQELIYDRLGDPHRSAQRTLPLKGHAELHFIGSTGVREPATLRHPETGDRSPSGRCTQPFPAGFRPSIGERGLHSEGHCALIRPGVTLGGKILRREDYRFGTDETVHELKAFHSEFRYRVPPAFAFHWLTDFEEGKGFYRLMSQTGPLRVRVHEDARMVERLGWKPITRFTVRLTGPLTWTRTIELYDIHGRLQGHSLVEEELQESESGTLHQLGTTVTARTSLFRIVYVLGGRRSMIQSLDEQYRDVKERMESDFRRSRSPT
jgi:hypothetical protein